MSLNENEKKILEALLEREIERVKKNEGHLFQTVAAFLGEMKYEQALETIRKKIKKA